jgi:Putative zinc-finger
MVVNCEQVWHEISNYLEGEVDPALRSAMEEHFRSCKRCASVLEGTRNVIQLYGDPRFVEVPAGFSRRLEKRIAQNVRVGRIRWSAWLIPIAALALIAGGVQLASSFTSAPPLKSEHAQPGHGIPPDTIVLVSAGTKLFHVAGCPFIHNKDKVRTMTAQEAIREGYVPCLRCMRKYLDVAANTRPGADSDDPDDEDTKGEGD